MAVNIRVGKFLKSLIMQVDTLIHAKWIIPVEPENMVHEDHAIAIRGDRIEALLPSKAARAQYSARSEIELQRHALIPGLVNAHTHAAMSLFRGLANDLPLQQWLNDHIWPAEARWVSAEFVRDGTGLAVAEMIRGGTTCFNDMYFFPEQTAAVSAAAGMRAVIGLICINFRSAWAADTDEYLHKGIAAHDAYRLNPLISTAFAPHAPYSVGDEALRQIGALAEELDIPIHMHVHETAGEVEQGLAQHGQRPLRRLAGLGLLSPRLLAVHMTQLEPAEIEELARLGVSVAHCPQSNLKLASGFCQAAALNRAGVNVCLGADGAASNNDLDMISEMQSAALLGKAVAQDSAALNAHTTLRMATLNGARALGLGAEIGSLKPGKQADIAALDLDQIETVPLYAPLEQIIYAGGREQVTDVWIAGRQVLRERALTTLDDAGLMAKAKEWGQKIKA